MPPPAKVFVFQAVSLEGIQLVDDNGNAIPQPVFNKRDVAVGPVPLHFYARPEELFLGLHHLEYLQDYIAHVMGRDTEGIQRINFDLRAGDAGGEDGGRRHFEARVLTVQGESLSIQALVRNMRSRGPLTFIDGWREDESYDEKVISGRRYVDSHTVATAIATWDALGGPFASVWGSLVQQDGRPAHDPFFDACQAVKPSVDAWAAAARAPRALAPFALHSSVVERNFEDFAPQWVFLFIWALQDSTVARIKSGDFDTTGSGGAGGEAAEEQRLKASLPPSICLKAAD